MLASGVPLAADAGPVHVSCVEPKCDLADQALATSGDQVPLAEALYAGGSVTTNCYIFCSLGLALTSIRFAMTDGSSKFRIYTKTGDKGTSALYNGERRNKDDEVFHALGDVDELNSAIGVAVEFLDASHDPLIEQLQVVQSRILDLGSSIATPLQTSSDSKIQHVKFSPDATPQLESWLDSLDDQLPPLHNFILPSGGKGAACLHVARSVCRRAERSVVPLVRDERCEEQVAIYLNRLSDYLFTAARYAAHKEDKPALVYKKAADGARQVVQV